jgi:hypothetical protein
MCRIKSQQLDVTGLIVKLAKQLEGICTHYLQSKQLQNREEITKWKSDRERRKVNWKREG